MSCVSFTVTREEPSLEASKDFDFGITPFGRACRRTAEPCARGPNAGCLRLRADFAGRCDPPGAPAQPCIAGPAYDDPAKPGRGNHGEPSPESDARPGRAVSAQ